MNLQSIILEVVFIKTYNSLLSFPGAGEGVRVWKRPLLDISNMYEILQKYN